MGLDPRTWFRRGPSEADLLRRELALTRAQLEADSTALKLKERELNRVLARFAPPPAPVTTEQQDQAREIALRESWPGWFTGQSQFGAIISPLAGFYDGIAPLQSAVPTLWDYTLNLGFYVTEAWLDILRMYARVWYAVTPQAHGVMQGLTDYVIHTGFEYQVQPKPGLRVSQRLPEIAQRIVDDFLTANQWYETECDGFLRLHRDGEVFYRLYPSEDGVTRLRCIEPWQVRGQNTSPENMFGVITAPGDREAIQEYRVTMSGNGTDAEMVNRDRMAMMKANTDKQVKRGVSDFVATQQLFRELTTLLQNTQVGEALRQALVWVQETTGAANPLQEIGPLGQTNAGSPPNFGQPITWGPGQIPTMDKNLQFKPPPVGNTQNATQALQLAYQALSVYYRVPEWMVSGTSAANFAASLTQESPLVRMAQRKQKLCKDKYAAVVTMALRIAEEQELLEPGSVDRLTLNVEATPLVVREPASETARNKTLKDAGLLSDRTWSVREELDYDAERENLEEEAAYKKAHPELAPQQPGQQPDATSVAGDVPATPSADPSATYGRLAPRPEEGNGTPPLEALMEALDDPDDAELDLHEADRTHPVGVPYQSASGKSWLVNKDMGGGKIRAVRTIDPNKKTPAKAGPKTKAPTKAELAAKAKADAAANKAKARAAADKLAAGGEGLTHDDVAHLDAHFQTLTQPEMKAVAKALGEKLGGTKKALGGRLVAKAKELAGGGAKPKEEPKAEPAEPAAAPPASALAKKPGGDRDHVAALAASAPDATTRDYLDSALHNMAPAARKLDPEERRRQTVDRLAAVWRDATTAGHAAAADHIAGALAQFGADLHGPGAGEETAFDGRLHDSEHSAFTGDRVKVTRQPVILPTKDGGHYVAVKGAVAPAGKAAPEPAKTPASAPAAGGKGSGSVSALDDAGFAKAVQAAADHPEANHFGGSKTFISDVYQRLKKQDPSLDEGEFKARLLKLNASNHLDLSRADLVQLMNSDDVNASEIRHPLLPSATFHFVQRSARAPAPVGPARGPKTTALHPARAALDALGVDHADLSDEDAAAVHAETRAAARAAVAKRKR